MFGMGGMSWKEGMEFGEGLRNYTPNSTHRMLSSSHYYTSLTKNPSLALDASSIARDEAVPLEGGRFPGKAPRWGEKKDAVELGQAPESIGTKKR